MDNSQHSTPADSKSLDNATSGVILQRPAALCHEVVINPPIVLIICIRFLRPDISLKATLDYHWLPLAINRVPTAMKGAGMFAEKTMAATHIELNKNVNYKLVKNNISFFF